MYSYMLVTILLNDEDLGIVLFNLGEGNQAHYIHRANILSKPHLFQDEKGLDLTFKVEKIDSEQKRLIEVFIPKIE